MKRVPVFPLVPPEENVPKTHKGQLTSREADCAHRSVLCSVCPRECAEARGRWGGYPLLFCTSFSRQDLSLELIRSTGLASPLVNSGNPVSAPTPDAGIVGTCAHLWPLTRELGI